MINFLGRRQPIKKIFFPSSRARYWIITITAFDAFAYLGNETKKQTDFFLCILFIMSNQHLHNNTFVNRCLRGGEEAGRQTVRGVETDA